MMRFTIQRAAGMQVDECSDATEWEDFKVGRGEGEDAARDAVESAAEGEPGCYRARPIGAEAPIAYVRVTGDGSAHLEDTSPAT